MINQILGIGLQLLFVTFFIFLFFWAILVIKPYYVHSKRQFSTAFLKYTYLAYLIIFLIFVYSFMFNKNDMPIKWLSSDFIYAKYNFTAVAVSIIAPNASIFLRRKVKYRLGYNLSMGIINIFITIYIFILLRMMF